MGDENWDIEAQIINIQANNERKSRQESLYSKKKYLFFSFVSVIFIISLLICASHVSIEHFGRTLLINITHLEREDAISFTDKQNQEKLEGYTYLNPMGKTFQGQSVHQVKIGDNDQIFVSYNQQIPAWEFVKKAGSSTGKAYTLDNNRDYSRRKFEMMTVGRTKTVQLPGISGQMTVAADVNVVS